ncbi:MAG: hypothetical protein SOV56_05340 [Phascolarctobacterium sp.]|nr:hypothetical protein [Phascolarctobacterium sp.]
MKILVINGGCLRVNSSANLCHISYVKGLVENEHNITILSTSEKGQIIDESIILPQGPRYLFYERSILYNFMKPKQWSNIQREIQNNKKSIKVSIITIIKKILSFVYGPFGYNGVWVENVLKKYSINDYYDIVISISSPVYSHLAAIKLIEKGKIKCNKFIEIWEDPWQLDLYNKGIDTKLLAIEHELVCRADRVFYVSPITAKYQAEMFNDCKDKIDWVPLPYYYKDDTLFESDINYYGYFGDYFPVSRNLRPFYEAAKSLKIFVDICGAPNTLFDSTERIKIFPRMQLSELKKHENKTNVLVFLCNLRGGQIPGKIYQYSATLKKILFILDGTDDEIKTIYAMFKKYDRYYFCRNTVSDIERAIREIEGSTNCRIKNQIIEDFSPANIIKQIINKTM